MKPSNAANDNLIDRTIKAWEPRLDRNLSREDARQIVENATGFFSILAEWARAESPEPANATGKPDETNGDATRALIARENYGSSEDQS